MIYCQPEEISMIDSVPFLSASASGVQVICHCGQAMLVGGSLPSGNLPARCEYCELYLEITIDLASLKTTEAPAASFEAQP
jgi:hypothetical protein